MAVERAIKATDELKESKKDTTIEKEGEEDQEAKADSDDEEINLD